MIDESLRSRLESLNRGPMPVQIAPARTDLAVASTDLGATKPAFNGQHSAVGKPTKRIPSSTQTRSASSSIKCIPGLLRSGESVETAHGPHLRIRLPLENLWPNGTQLIVGRQEFLQTQ